MEELIITSQRTLDVVLDEIANLNRLIIQRQNWLADPINRASNTYQDVKKDTTDMIWKMRELNDEAKELKKQ